MTNLALMLFFGALGMAALFVWIAGTEIDVQLGHEKRRMMKIMRSSVRRRTPRKITTPIANDYVHRAYVPEAVTGFYAGVDSERAAQRRKKRHEN